jgi:asparagine synthase (glutamine-hydrolysing)
MSALLAIFNRRGQTNPDGVPEKMTGARPEYGPDGVDWRIVASTTLARQHFWVTPEEMGERQPIHLGHLSVVADARIDNRDDLGHLLGLEKGQLASLSDGQLILRAYERWGERCPSHLLGDFAFAIWDASEQMLFAARDSLGTRELSYYIDDRVAIVSTTLLAILQHPWVESKINNNCLGAYLAGIYDRHEETLYDAIHYLIPAHALIVTADTFRIWRYWEIDPSRTLRYRDRKEYSQHFRELLVEVVRCRLRTNLPVGISLSGGLDSTTIAALSAILMDENPSRPTEGRRLKTFSYVFNELTESDERRYIQPLVERYKLDAEFIPADDLWPLRNFAEWPSSPEYILADSLTLLPAAIMAAAGRAGMRILLTGYNGDVLFTGQNYWALDMLRHGRFRELAGTIAASYRSIDFRDSFFEFGLRRLIPASVAASYRKLKPRSILGISPGIDPRFIARTDIMERLSPTIPPGKWPPGMWQRYHTLTLSDNSQGPGAVRYQYNRQGVEHVLPYYDRRLIEFVMAVPAYILGMPDQDRLLHRETMEGILPDEIRLRQRGTSFVPLLLKGLRGEGWKTVSSILSDPQLVKRQIIRGDWLKQQLEIGFDYSSESHFVWNCFCLEIWLQRYWS